jgi:hypothetical protein
MAFTVYRSLGYIGLGKETTAGTGVSPTLFYKPIGDVLVSQTQNTMEIRNGNIRDLTAHVKTGINEAGTFKTLWYANEGAGLIAFAMGADSVSGVGDPYTHTITLANTLPSLSIDQGVASNAAIIRSTGNKIADLTMDVAVNEPCYLTATALGMTEDDSQSAATVSFTDTAGNGPFMFNQGAVTFTGPSDAATLNGQMRRCSIKIMQDTTVLPVVGQITPAGILERARTVEGTVDFVFSGPSLYYLAYNGTNSATAPSATVGSGSLAFTLTSQAAVPGPERSVAVTLANIDFLQVNLPRINANAAEAVVTATFRAKYLTTGPTYPISVVAKNSASAAYI